MGSSQTCVASSNNSYFIIQTMTYTDSLEAKLENKIQLCCINYKFPYLCFDAKHKACTYQTTDLSTADDAVGIGAPHQSLAHPPFQQHSALTANRKTLLPRPPQYMAPAPSANSNWPKTLPSPVSLLLVIAPVHTSPTYTRLLTSINPSRLFTIEGRGPPLS